MKSKIIKDSEVSSLKVSSLPTRPTASAAFGGKGYTASEMKAAFDRLPLRIIEGFNSLVEEIENGAVAELIATKEPFATLFSDLALIKAALGI